jgi:hypothetical protein
MAEKTQNERILEVLDSGEWVSPLAFSHISLSHTRRIHELRMEGHEIILLDERIDGRRRTKYRLRPSTPEERQERVATRSKPFPAPITEFKRVCLFCKGMFTAKRKNAKFCPDKPCRTNYWKANGGEQICRTVSL